MDPVSVVALLVALAVAVFQWRVARDIRAIRAEVTRLTDGED